MVKVLLKFEGKMKVVLELESNLVQVGEWMFQGRSGGLMLSIMPMLLNKKGRRRRVRVDLEILVGGKYPIAY